MILILQFLANEDDEIKIEFSLTGGFILGVMLCVWPSRVVMATVNSETRDEATEPTTEIKTKNTKRGNSTKSVHMCLPFAKGQRSKVTDRLTISLALIVNRVKQNQLQILDI